MNYTIFYDLETGGLKPEQNDLLTAFFAVVDENMKIVEELNLKLKPDGRLPICEAAALKVNGIDILQHIADPETVTYMEGGNKLAALLKKYLKRKGRYSNLTFGGFNIRGFDNKWLQFHLLDEKTMESLVHYKYLDVMDDIDVLKRHGWLPGTVGNLGSAVDFFGVPKGEAHEAKGDVHMTIGLYKKIKEFMDSKKAGGSGQDLISLLEAE